jgi:hypothetical protein
MRPPEVVEIQRKFLKKPGTKPGFFAWPVLTTRRSFGNLALRAPLWQRTPRPKCPVFVYAAAIAAAARITRR